jgi:maltooligosyltrehalose trehalohydrolase
MPAQAHVICLQNHDLVGNRPQGERLTVLVPLGARFLAAALLLLAPQTPLLFMGEEYDEQNPFLFFTDYGDPRLVKAVRTGRVKDLRELDFAVEELPDPQAPATFARSELNWQLAHDANRMLKWHQSLLNLRKRFVMDGPRSGHAEVVEGVIHMQVPAASPKVRVLARIVCSGSDAGSAGGSAALPEPGVGWKRELTEEADGYAVSVDVKAS